MSWGNTLLRLGVSDEAGAASEPRHHCRRPIISAPSSTKNRAKARDPEMHQTKKGNQWYFGMKAHIGVDSQTKPDSFRSDHGGECA